MDRLSVLIALSNKCCVAMSWGVTRPRGLTNCYSVRCVLMATCPVPPSRLPTLSHMVRSCANPWIWPGALVPRPLPLLTWQHVYRSVWGWHVSVWLVPRPTRRPMLTDIAVWLSLMWVLRYYSRPHTCRFQLVANLVNVGLGPSPWFARSGLLHISLPCGPAWPSTLFSMSPCSALMMRLGITVALYPLTLCRWMVLLSLWLSIF